MFDLGTQELIVIFIVAFLVFGPKKLPELGRTLGKGIRELKAAMRGVKESFEEAGADVSEEIKKEKNGLEESIYKSIESNIGKEEEEGEKESDAQENKNTSMSVEEGSKEEKKETDKNG